MEFAGLLNHIDDNDVGETWIDILIRCFNFPDSPLLFTLLSQVKAKYVQEGPSKRVNKRVGYLKEKSVKSSDDEECACHSLGMSDFWSWTKYCCVDKTRVVILAGQQKEGEGDVFSTRNVTSQVESNWGEQGVIVLRHSPDCEDDEAWTRIVYQLTEYMVNNCPTVLFVLEGSFVPKFLQDGSRVIHLHNNKDDKQKVFSLLNEKLAQLGQKSVQWTLP